MSQTAKRAVLEQAVKLLGRTNVATRFGVPETLLGAWMRGETPMPTRNLLVLAVMLDQLATVQDSAVKPCDGRRAQ